MHFSQFFLMLTKSQAHPYHLVTVLLWLDFELIVSSFSCIIVMTGFHFTTKTANVCLFACMKIHSSMQR
jgi:hypothetical protein